MGRLRDKAEQLRKDAEASRDVKDLRGTPLKLYRYYEKHAVIERTKRPTFCHVFWAVVFWAPLAFVRNMLLSKVGIGIMSVGATLMVAYLVHVSWQYFGEIGPIVGGALLILYLTLGLVLGVFYGAGVDFDKPEKIAFYATAPTSFPTWSIARGIRWVAETWTRKRTRAVQWFGISLMIVGFTWTFVDLTLEYGAKVPLILLGSLATAATFIAIIIGLEGYARAKKTQRERAHSEWLDSLSYEEYWKWRSAQLEEMGRANRKPQRVRKHRVKKFFRGIGDGMIFVGHYVRAKKWGVCPFIEIPEDTARG